MSGNQGASIFDLDSPQLIIDLDILDKNLGTITNGLNGKKLRVHFKSLKCGGLVKYLMDKGCNSFLCAKLNEAEVLADVGVKNILIANQIVGDLKIARVDSLKTKANVKICIDCEEHLLALTRFAQKFNTSFDVLAEVDIGMNRCGTLPGKPTLELVKKIVVSKNIRFSGLQGYDGHLQLMLDRTEKTKKAFEGLASLVDTRRMIEKEGIAVPLVTTAGTGTWEFAVQAEGIDEIQPGSFLLMDCIYNEVRPEFHPSLTVLSTVISRRPGLYVLDAGSKAISKDFGMPMVKGKPQEKIFKLAEEHTRVECGNPLPEIGDKREVVTAHCCATMNLHRNVVAARNGKVVDIWPIEASGRYD
ncbi:MAG: DSD1 family PLP-dependent enzyme [Planctomycetes bacterium]|nr:DSD1 family PLP-dependent enzyme [Planctomycetota bacterium]NBY03411.1 DSD1 family PLP-dependent enzyme [Planctomycetota bacterium]